ncbi:MAG: hypothetical protein ABIQ01_11090 [Pseudolysinimonas sp.]
MNGFIKRGLLTVLVTGGFLALGAGVAYADDTTDGSNGTASGSQAVLGINLPITIGGNGISVLGDSSSSGSSNTGSSGGSPPSVWTGGTNSLLGGTQGVVDANVPVTIGGNAVSVLGDSSSEGASFEGESGSGDAGYASTSGKDGIAGGTQIVGDVSAPIAVSGNAISVAGDSFSGRSGTASGSSSDGTGGSSATTSGDDSVAGGSQMLADAGVPVVVGGNAISVIGDSSSEGSTVSGGSGGSDEGDLAFTDGSDGIVGGSQVVADAAAPVTASGNALSVVGDASTSDSDASSPITGGSPAAFTTGDEGVLSGTQLVTGADAPVTLGGNAVSVIGDSTVDDGTDGDDGGDVGGETITPPDTTAGDTTAGVTTAALGAVSLLAATGSDLLIPALALALLLLAAGVVFLSRTRTVRR